MSTPISLHGVTILDKNRKPLMVGAHVRVKHCTGPYGQTREVCGLLQEVDVYGGINITLDANHPSVYAGGNRPDYKGGDKYRAVMQLEVDSAAKVLVCYYKHEDYEHFHETWVEEI